MFISKSMRIFALTILLVPVAQPAMALSPRMKDVIAKGIARTVVSAYLAGAFTLFINTGLRNASSPTVSGKPVACTAIVAGLFSALFGYLDYIQADRAEETENRAKNQEEKVRVRKAYTAAELTAEFARIRNMRIAREAAQAAQNARSYNASLESARAQRLVQSREYNAANRSERAQRLMK